MSYKEYKNSLVLDTSSMVDVDVRGIVYSWSKGDILEVISELDHTNSYTEDFEPVNSSTICDIRRLVHLGNHLGNKKNEIRILYSLFKGSVVMGSETLDKSSSSYIDVGWIICLVRCVR